MMSFGRMLWSTALVLAGSAVVNAQFDLPGSRQTPAPTGAPRTTRMPNPDPRPVSAFDLKAEHGTWLVVVKSFRGEKELNSQGLYEPDTHVKELAESFAEFIRKQYKINAYVYPRGWEVRKQRDEEAKAYRTALRKYYMETKGINPTPEMLKVKTVNVPDEYTVFVAPARGTLKDRDAAIDFANQVRQLKAPAEFNDKFVRGTDDKITDKGSSINAFLASMAGMNPMVPKTAPANQAEKVEDFVMQMNSGEKYSLLHKTNKKWTLLVQKFGGDMNVIPASAVGTGNNKASSNLELAALQAQEYCNLLRSKKIEAYVLHTRYHSMVFVGQYDSKDDPELLSNTRIFAKKEFKDEKSGKVMMSFMDKPAAVMIPRP